VNIVVSFKASKRVQQTRNIAEKKLIRIKTQEANEQRINKEEQDKKERDERLQRIREDVRKRRRRHQSADSHSPVREEHIRTHSAVNILERNNTKKLLVINRLEGALKNCTMHQSIKALEKIKDERRKRELVKRDYYIDGEESEVKGRACEKAAKRREPESNA
jgi:hypothetical protein